MRLYAYLHTHLHAYKSPCIQAEDILSLIKSHKKKLFALYTPKGTKALMIHEKQ